MNPIPVILLCYTIQGTQPRYLPGDAPNPDYLSEIYVCAPTSREMLNLIRRHLPKEELTIVEVVQSAKGWPSNMKWVAPEPGVWGSKYRNGASVFRFEAGVKTELD